MKDVIRSLRKKAGLSQSALADKLNIHQTAVSQWEKGRTLPDIETLSKLANILQTTTDHLLGLTSYSSDETGSLYGQKEKPAIDKNDELTEQEKKYLKMYREASPELKVATSAMLEAAEKVRLDRDSSAKDK